MKDAAHHRKHVQKKVLQSIRREANRPVGASEETINGTPSNKLLINGFHVNNNKNNS